MGIFRVTPGLTAKGACPVVSCPATMEVAAHLLQGVHDASAWKVLVAPSVSISVMKAALPSPAAMEGCALKRLPFHTSTVSVRVAGQVNGVRRASSPWNLSHPCALLQIVRAKLMMVYVTRNVIHCLVTGMVVTVHWQWIPGPIVHAAGAHSIIASVMTPATMLTVCMTTLTAKTKRKFASGFISTFNKLFCVNLRNSKLILLFLSFSVQYTKHIVLTTMLTDGVTRAATQRSADGMGWIVQWRFQKTLQMVSWFWLSCCLPRSFCVPAQHSCKN